VNKKYTCLGLFWIFLLFWTNFSLFSEVFRFRHTKGEKYKLITEVKETIYIDGQLQNQAEILNKIAVEILEVNGTSGLLAGQFIVSEKKWNSQVYNQEDQQHTSQFWRDEQGKYTIEKKYLYPIVRSIPLFPKKDLKIGDLWTSEGEEVHDLSVWGVTEPLHIPLTVYYEYIDKKQIDGIEVAVFKIHYTSVIDLRKISKPGANPLAKIKGDAEQIYRWDIKKSRTHSYDDTFDFIYIFHNGQVVEFEGNSQGVFIPSPELDREQVKDDIQKEIDEKGLDNVTVTADDEGVTITIENIQFTPDSANLLPVEKQKLDTIGEILEKYPSRDLMIVGHTAFAGIEQGLQKLSEDRAEAVGNYLLDKGVRERQQLIFKGMGPRQPLGDNNTEAGKRKNRRVEIKILEN
jgi:outer membrane protein OmpA-like peptidoglycan-associated protein